VPISDTISDPMQPRRFEKKANIVGDYPRPASGNRAAYRSG
jgi:hypothetical protein